MYVVGTIGYHVSLDYGGMRVFSEVYHVSLAVAFRLAS
jgi:hypothetical protein